jgi:hypothetical protein
MLSGALSARPLELKLDISILQLDTEFYYRFVTP